jgi:hypothetical protein
LAFEHSFPDLRRHFGDALMLVVRKGDEDVDAFRLGNDGDGQATECNQHANRLILSHG